MLQEVLLQGGLVFVESAVGMMPRTAMETRQATLEVLVQVALDGATGDVRVGGDVVVVQAVALEPEHFHLALDAGVGVVIPVMGQGLPVFRREGDRAHVGSTRGCSQVAARQQFIPTYGRRQFVPNPAAPSI
jgi:hypothetical protein